MCCTETVKVREGETLRRRFEIMPACPSDVIVVQSAVWALIDHLTGEVAAQGSCEIDGRKLWCLIPFVEAGMYELKCTAVIPPETIINSVYIRVVE